MDTPKYVVPTKCEFCDKDCIYQVVPEGTCGSLHICAEHLPQAANQAIEWDAQTLVSRKIDPNLAAAQITHC